MQTMNAIATDYTEYMESQPFTDISNINSLVIELEHYRRQSEWLAMVNELHSRLA